jgi:hypothetical protein
MENTFMSLLSGSEKLKVQWNIHFTTETEIYYLLFLDTDNWKRPDGKLATWQLTKWNGLPLREIASFFRPIENSLGLKTPGVRCTLDTEAFRLSTGSWSTGDINLDHSHKSARQAQNQSGTRVQSRTTIYSLISRDTWAASTNRRLRQSSNPRTQNKEEDFCLSK